MTGADKGLSRRLKVGGALLLVLGGLVPSLIVLQESSFIPEEERIKWSWSWQRALSAESIFWSLWLLFLPLITRLVRRFPLDARRWARHLPFYVVAAAIITTLHLVMHVALANSFLLPPRDRVDRFFINWGGSMTTYEVFTFAALVTGIHAYGYARRYKEEVLRVAELEAQLVRSQLESLKTQLQPHFLFNTLHAISALMYQDVEAADRMIARLSGLLRASLQSAPRQRVPLREELEFLQGYLEIEQARLGDRLTVRTTIAPATLDASVPNLILQPLVENAVRHGIAPRLRPGQISIDARRNGDELEIEIQDNGPGLAQGSFTEGIGLGNVRARMERLYGPYHRFELKNGASGGLTVRLVLPFQIHEA
jgi:two-component system, LytTR family, sensor kinase